MNTILQPNTKKELDDIIKNEIKLHGNECDLNHIDTSLITNMNGLFLHSQFNGDISKWNVSKVTNMDSMFANSYFNSDISLWDVSKVTHMNYMFHYAQLFNRDLSDWKPLKLESNNDMFDKSICSIPYWHSDNIEEVQEKIKKYQEMKNLKDKLNDELSIQIITNSKIKI